MSAQDQSATDDAEQNDDHEDGGPTLGTNVMRRQGSASVVITMPQHVRSRKNINIGEIWEFKAGESEDPNEIVLKNTGVKNPEYKGFDEDEDNDE